MCDVISITVLKSREAKINVAFVESEGRGKYIKILIMLDNYNYD